MQGLAIRKEFVLWGAKSEETLAVREVKCGARQKDVGSDSPSGTTNAPENH